MDRIVVFSDGEDYARDARIGGMGAADSAMSQPSCIFLFSTIPFQAAFTFNSVVLKALPPSRELLRRAVRCLQSVARSPLNPHRATLNTSASPPPPPRWTTT